MPRSSETPVPSDAAEVQGSAGSPRRSTGSLRDRLLLALAHGGLFVLGIAVLLGGIPTNHPARQSEALLILVCLGDVMTFMAKRPRDTARNLRLLGLWAPALLATALWGLGRLGMGIRPEGPVLRGLHIALLALSGLVGGLLLPDLRRAARAFPEQVRRSLPGWTAACSLGGGLAICAAALLALVALASGAVSGPANIAFWAIGAGASGAVGVALLRRRSAPSAAIQPYCLVALFIGLDVLCTPLRAGALPTAAAAAHLLATALLAPEFLLRHRDLYEAGDPEHA